MTERIEHIAEGVTLYLGDCREVMPTVATDLVTLADRTELENTMNDLSQTLKEGDLLVIETGEYSDSSWSGPVRMLVTATKQELADAFRSEWNKKDYPDSWSDEASNYDFLPWLIKTKRAEHIDCSSWHVGSYGSFEP